MRDGVAVVAAVLLIGLVLIVPNHPLAATWGALRVFPLELPAIVIALALVRGPALRALRAFVAVWLVAITALKLADFATHTAFDRSFNPALDLHLGVAAWRMLSGAVGWPLALTWALGLAAGLALLARALWWATGRVARLAPSMARGPALALVPVGALTLAAADVAREVSPANPPGAAFTARLTWEHGREIVRARVGLAAFRLEATRDDMAALPLRAILPALAGTDVLLIFVESYGRATLEQPIHAPRITATLTEIEARLAQAGLAMRSGYLTAPMVGGQSWLAHASVLSGLTIDTQARYRALLASPRRTLLHLAQSAGWRTVAVMPAITLAWPEAGYFGYDRVLAAADLGYEGAPFNWVTMPDQFTLAAFERAELAARDRPPVMAEIALISSHAPWTPIPPLLPWGELGDGRVFDRHATAGEAPEDLWRDLDRVREQFGLAIDYSLRTVGAFAERRAASAPLIVVLGDHQPASFVSLDADGRDVPIHVIGSPEALALIAGWGWTPGLVPAPDAPAWPMGEFRDRFLDAFSTANPAWCDRGATAGPLPIADRC